MTKSSPDELAERLALLEEQSGAKTGDLTIANLKSELDTLAVVLGQRAQPILFESELACQRVTTFVRALGQSSGQSTNREHEDVPEVMQLTADQFAKAVIAAGLSSAEEIKTLWASIPSGTRPKNGEMFAKLLIQRGKLSDFQSQELLSGSSLPLVLGDYVLLGRIGAGGMGQVFKAQHQHMDRVVAIKLLPTALTKDAAAVQRFQREVKAAAKLSHPNIVQAFDASVQRGVWYLVMEYVEGRDLSAVVAAEGAIPIARALEYIRQTARGLAFAHENGVVHRDIKPANLLLDKKGTVKILDMGLARLDDATVAANEGLTQSGQVMGTIDYMAPEQAFSTHTADARADVYSLGCTLYRLLTGANLFEANTLVQKMMAHQKESAPNLCRVLPAAPRDLNVLFQKMVAKEPNDRYPTMAALESAITSLLAELPAGDSNGQSFRAYATENSEPTVKLAGALQGTDPLPERTVELARAEIFSPAIAKSSPRWRHPLVIAAGLAGALLVMLGVWVIIRDKDGKEIARVSAPDGVEVEIVRERPNVPKPVPRVTKPSVVGAKTTTDINDPTFQQWMKHVAAMPAEEQVEAVRTKLMELNEGFDGTLMLNQWGQIGPKIENDKVIEFGFFTNNVRDISPVRALTDLKTLFCGCDVQHLGDTPLTDISPLRGFRLTSLSLFYNKKLVDISALQGMPLTNLDCGDTGVSDLSPLKDMPLTTLDCRMSPVKSLTPLKAMQLTSLMLQGCDVSDLTPLRGMPLTILTLRELRFLSDLSPLEGMELTSFDCMSTAVKDLSPLRGMKLTALAAKSDNALDFSVVKEMPLKIVEFHIVSDRDLEMFRSLKTLESINGRPVVEYWKEVDAQR